MRPGVYASVVRNRKQSSRRVHPMQHTFSLRRLVLMLFVGAVLLIPGLVVTIIGIPDEYATPGDRVLYKVIGPAACACGIGLILAAGIYYGCWGFQATSRRRHTTSSTSSVPAVSGSTGQSAYSSVRAHDSPNHRAENVNTSPCSPETKSNHHSHHSNSQHHPLHHGTHHSYHGRTRTSSKSSHSSEVSHRGYHHDHHHTHRSSSLHHNNHHSDSHHSTKHLDNQVSFAVSDAAPLAQGESGSVDLHLDRKDTFELQKKC